MRPREVIAKLGLAVDSGMTPEEAIAMLDATDLDEDPEMSHQQAEGIICQMLPPEVLAAYVRRIERTWGWWFA